MGFGFRLKDQNKGVVLRQQRFVFLVESLIGFQLPLILFVLQSIMTRQVSLTSIWKSFSLTFEKVKKNWKVPFSVPLMESLENHSLLSPWG
jgi:hypothetical protein